MNKTLILQLDKHDIYLLSDNNISFYISIPKIKEFSAVNISIDLKDNFNKLNINENDMIYVKDELSAIYKEIDYENITLVIPIFHNDILNRIKTNPTEGLYNYLDKCISYIINNAYKTLVSFNVSVNSKIVIVENEKFKGFIDWFSKRYSSRIDTKQYSELIGEFTSVIPVISTNDIANITQKQKEQAEGNIPVKEKTSSGFISYVLLGAICIVVTLIILYKLL